MQYSNIESALLNQIFGVCFFLCFFLSFFLCFFVCLFVYLFVCLFVYYQNNNQMKSVNHNLSAESIRRNIIRDGELSRAICDRNKIVKIAKLFIQGSYENPYQFHFLTSESVPLSDLHRHNKKVIIGISFKMRFDDLTWQYAVFYIFGWFFVILLSLSLLFCIGCYIYGKINSFSSYKTETKNKRGSLF